MSDRSLRELLEEATRDIPADVSRPPMARIHKQGRWHRIAWPVRISGGLGAIVVASAVALTVPGAQPQPTPVPSTAQAAWSHAQVAEDGTTLTIYIIQPPGRCMTLWGPHATSVESDQAVTVSVTGDVAPGNCGNPGGEGVVTVQLERPLGGRILRDATNGLDRVAFSEVHLPVIPAGGDWSRVDRRSPVGLRAPDADPWWTGGHYTKPGGPDIKLYAYEKATGPPTLPAIGRMRLGTREWPLRPALNTDTFELFWDDGLVTYCVTLVPSESGRVTEAQFRDVVGGFAWP
ncbi:hypothetical protein [Allorhizocola rhizosphaerae]|uniref:hypothetical protein n=1 Tax=Allorhizocola rhizosphaerae TaxID=1872709 RepID=UPI000E3B95EB|nr:hypothetical protein [Allorhizocola rhizosphaerae]